MPRRLENFLEAFEGTNGHQKRVVAPQNSGMPHQNFQEKYSPFLSKFQPILILRP